MLLRYQPGQSGLASRWFYLRRDKSGETKLDLYEIDTYAR